MTIQTPTNKLPDAAPPVGLPDIATLTQMAGAFFSAAGFGAGAAAGAFGGSSAACSFAHASLSATVRLNTTAPGFVSRSSVKYPSRSNWNRSPDFAPAKRGSR